MRAWVDLQRTLRRIDGKGYGAYRDIEGTYDMDGFQLTVDHVQGDPFAPPSRIRVTTSMSDAGFPRWSYASRTREVALRDLMTRMAHTESRRCGSRAKGSVISVDGPGQEVLERSSVVISPEAIELRLTVGLPAVGRRIAGRAADGILSEDLPAIVRSSMRFGSYDEEAVRRHVETVEDSDWLRGRLEGMGLVAFVADGSLLPRRSGADPRPMEAGVVPFRSPPSMSVDVDLPNRGPVCGMGVPEGVTLIVGGGYHGKSTLLDAIELGVYDHVPGDGRELVVTDPTAVKIRAEDGRRIEDVDITPFISDLPLGRDTSHFRTEDASGSTSQAANIMEALEVGAGLLLIDEDTSATNFMIRDRRMQLLVSDDREPITPFVDRVSQLYEGLGTSTIIVLGGSGDYLDVADRVVRMDAYVPEDVTDEARRIASENPTGRTAESSGPLAATRGRVPMGGSLDPIKGRRPFVRARGLRLLSFGTTDVDLSSSEQLVDGSQTRALAAAMLYAKGQMGAGVTMRELVERVVSDVQREGLDVLSRDVWGDRAMFRPHELAAAIDRLRTLRVVDQ